MSDQSQEPEISLETLTEQKSVPQIEAEAAAKKAAEDKKKEEGTISDTSLKDSTKENPPKDTTGEDTSKFNIPALVSSFNSENATEEDKALKKELLEHFKGESFDENGNVLDKDGKIIAKDSDLDTFLNGEEGEGGEEESKTVVSEVINELGVTINDEDGNPKQYEDSTEGFKNFAEDYSDIIADQKLDKLLSQNPELVRVAKHLLAGKPIDTYNKNVDYSKIDSKTLTKEQKLDYIRKDFRSKGFAPERIEATVQRIVDSNAVDAEVGLALSSLQLHDKELKAKEDADYQATLEAENKKIEQHWEKVNTVISKGKLEDINIPEKERQGFFNYLAMPVDKQGNSKDSIDAANETLEQQLKIAFLRYKGYDLSALIKFEAGKKRVESLRERLRNSAKTKNIPIANDKVGNSGELNDDDISISSLLG